MSLMTNEQWNKKEHVLISSNAFSCDRVWAERGNLRGYVVPGDCAGLILIWQD